MSKLVVPPVKFASKSPDNLAHLRPEMPQIPGVGDLRLSASTSANANSTRLVQIGGLATAVLVMGVAILWWVKSTSHSPSDRTSSKAATEVSTPPPAALIAQAPVTEDRAVVATARELAKPWSAKQFTFVRPFTHEKIPAMVIRLPGGGLWAFALQEPYGHCELEFVRDLGQISNRFGYHASHPMLASPCTSTVYDPLKVGALGDNIWARGEIVQGGGLRPPTSIDVLEKGGSIIADRIE